MQSIPLKIENVKQEDLKHEKHGKHDETSTANAKKHENFARTA